MARVSRSSHWSHLSVTKSSDLTTWQVNLCWVAELWRSWDVKTAGENDPVLLTLCIQYQYNNSIWCTKRQDLAPKQRIENIYWTLLNYFHHALTQIHTPFEVRWMAGGWHPRYIQQTHCSFGCISMVRSSKATSLPRHCRLVHIWRFELQAMKPSVQVMQPAVVNEGYITPSLPSLITEVPILFSLEVPASINEGPQTKKQCQETLSYPCASSIDAALFDTGVASSAIAQTSAKQSKKSCRSFHIIPEPFKSSDKM